METREAAMASHDESQKLKIALIQLHIQTARPEANYARAETFVRSAAAKGAQLAVLPEYHLVGWQPESAAWRAVAGKAGEYLRRYQALARELGVGIVPGTLVEELDGGDEGGGSHDTSDEGHKIQHKHKHKHHDHHHHHHHHNDGTGSAGYQLKRAKLVNAAYFIGPDGEVLARYVKRNLWHPERAHLEAGGNTTTNTTTITTGTKRKSQHTRNESDGESSSSSSSGSGSSNSSDTPASQHHTAFDTPWGRMGLLVCWDLAFPEAARALAADGARVILVPTYWLASDGGPGAAGVNEGSERVFVDAVAVARACENVVALAVVNAGGPAAVAASAADAASTGVAGGGGGGGGGVEEEEEEEEEGISHDDTLHYLGGSQLAMPIQGALNRLGATEDTAMVTVDFGVLDVAEDVYRVRHDMARHDWHYARPKEKRHA